MVFVQPKASSAQSEGFEPSHTGVINARLLMLSWAHFLNDGMANFLPGVLPAVLHSLHIRLTLVGSLMAAILVCQGMQPLFGWAADRLGGRMFVIGALGFGSLAGAFVGFVPNYWALIMTLLVVGMANAAFHPQALSCVRHTTAHHFALAMSIFLVGGELGRAVWPLIASLVAANYGLRALWLLALPTFVTLPMMIRQCPRARRVPISQRSAKNPVSWGSITAMTALVFYCALHAMLVYSLSTFLPILWRSHGGTLVGGASTVTILLMVGNLGNLMGGYLADRFGRRRLIGAAGALCALLLGAFLVSHTAVRWFFLAALGLATFSTMPVRILLAQDILPEHQSLGSGLALGFANALGALAVAGLGPVAARWGVHFALWLTAGLTVLSLAAVPLLPKDELCLKDYPATGEVVA